MNTMSKNEIDYWLFSNADQAKFFRRRNEFSLEEFKDVTFDEAQEICFKIRENLENGKYYTIYVKLLVLFNDTLALPLLRKWEQEFLKRRRSVRFTSDDWGEEIRLLRDAIKHLEGI